MRRPAVQPKKHPIGQTIKKFFDRKVEKKVTASSGSSSITLKGVLSQTLIYSIMLLQVQKSRETPSVIDLCDKDDGRHPYLLNVWLIHHLLPLLQLLRV